MGIIYENFRKACSSRGTNITAVLQEMGKSSGSTGAWKAGKSPSLETAMEMAGFLGMSLDQLCYGIGNTRTVVLSEEEAEWLSLMRAIPPERRELCKDFLRTHMAEGADGEKAGKVGA